jgi:hypothetical protein
MPRQCLSSSNRSSLCFKNKFVGAHAEESTFCRVLIRITHIHKKKWGYFDGEIVHLEGLDVVTSIFTLKMNPCILSPRNHTSWRPCLHIDFWFLIDCLSRSRSKTLITFFISLASVWYRILESKDFQRQIFGAQRLPPHKAIYSLPGRVQCS